MIYEFSAEQIAQINSMGMVSRFGAMQGPLLPSPDLPLTLDSFAGQYEEQAKYALKTFGLDGISWQMLAEMWAATDIDIFRDLADAGEDVVEFLREEHKKLEL